MPCLKKKHRYYGLGFLTKAFGLWYANIPVCCGVTQWTSPALKIHSHYGVIEVLTAYHSGSRSPPNSHLSTQSGSKLLGSLFHRFTK